MANNYNTKQIKRQGKFELAGAGGDAPGFINNFYHLLSDSRQGFQLSAIAFGKRSILLVVRYALISTSSNLFY